MAERDRAWTRVMVVTSRRSAAVRPGFSLLELLLVMTVTLLLTGMMLPVLAGLRESAHRVVCSSNLRQVGLMVVMWYDEEGELPPTYFAGVGKNKYEMMAAHRGGDPDNWEGLGHLYRKMYCDSPEVFYCPSHMGDHPYEKYAGLYYSHRRATYHGNGDHLGDWIYTNYHYAGHVDWTDNKTKHRLDGVDGANLVIATDGLRTTSDFNHRTGLNVLRGDGAVNWREDSSTRTVAELLPVSLDDTDDPPERFRLIWKILVDVN